MNFNIKNASLLALCGVATTPALARESAQTDNEKMNVIFFLVDDLRWNSLHCMGTDFLITPNIDALAEDGVIFDNAFVTTGISCVSRASLLSGQYMSRHNIRGFKKNFDEEHFADTYPARLREAGYWTGFVGKYGVGTPRKADFDFVTNYSGIHWYPEGKGSKKINLGGGYTRIEGDSIHVTQRNLRDAMKFLDERPTDKPFNLSVSFYATHAEDKHPDQYRYQPQSASLYEDIDIPVSDKATDEYLHGLPDFIQSPKNEGRKRWHWRFDDPEKHQRMMKSYYRLLTEVDTVIGQIVDRLKEEGLYENTMIVFMGDNGYFHSEYQLADKWYPYAEATRVPLIVHDPRLSEKQRGVRREEMALNVDIAPTMLSAAGVDVPEVMQGEDLSILYKDNKRKGWRKDFFYEHPVISRAERIPESQALITEKSKYIYWGNFDVEEYYDYKRDKKEAHNVIDDPKFAKKIAASKARFEVLREAAK